MGPPGILGLFILDSKQNNFVQALTYGRCKIVQMYLFFQGGTELNFGTSRGPCPPRSLPGYGPAAVLDITKTCKCCNISF